MNDYSELKTLINQLLSQQLSEDDAQKLESILSSDSEARRIYYSYIDLDSSLQQLQDFDRSPVPLKATPATQKSSLTGWIVGCAMTACVLLAWFVTSIGEKTNQEIVENAEQETGVEFPVSSLSDKDAVAIVRDQVEAEWETKESISVGDILKIGNLVLKKGMAQIDFPGGAQIILNGPAELNLRGSKAVTLVHGEASCFVSELGKGFEFIAGETKIVDLGTSFSTSVGKNSTDIQVNDGEIEIHDIDENGVRNLIGRKAVRLVGNKLVDIDYQPRRYPSQAKLQTKKSEAEVSRLKAWSKLANRYSEDADTLVHYRMDRASHSSHEVVNSVDPKRPARGTNGLVIGAEWVEGRWPRKRGLLFRRDNDHLMTRIKELHDEFTLFLWVRPEVYMDEGSVLCTKEHPNRWLNSGFLQPGEFPKALEEHNSTKNRHFIWSLRDMASTNGRMELHMYRNEKKSSDKFRTRKNSLQFKFRDWTSLAVTFSNKQSSLVFYKDGIQCGENELKTLEAFNLDFLSIGNFSSSRREPADNYHRRFFGVIDEVLISGRKFDNEEIETLHRIGMP